MSAFLLEKGFKAIPLHKAVNFSAAETD